MSRFVMCVEHGVCDCEKCTQKSFKEAMIDLEGAEITEKGMKLKDGRFFPTKKSEE